MALDCAITASALQNNNSNAIRSRPLAPMSSRLNLLTHWCGQLLTAARCAWGVSDTWAEVLSRDCDKFTCGNVNVFTAYAALQLGAVSKAVCTLPASYYRLKMLR